MQRARARERQYHVADVDDSGERRRGDNVWGRTEVEVVHECRREETLRGVSGRRCPETRSNQNNEEITKQTKRVMQSVEGHLNAQ